MRLARLALFVLTAAPVAAQPDPLGRPADPVVLSGAQTDALRAIAPTDLVAFRYDGGAWIPIPVQVDERFVVDYAQVYNRVADYGRDFSALAYADPGTFTGPDSDASLDADDEVAFMAADAGAQAPASEAPSGVDAATRVEVQLDDPLDADRAFVYLFRRTAALDPAAGADYVRYTFRLNAGTYLADYDIRNGPNPEDTDLTTDLYARHFSDRWVSDELTVDGGADLLDRLHIFYGEGRGGSPNCARTEDTFSKAEGAFVTNKDGPVRAIRTVVGANSGPLTERTHLFYARREDIVTTLRVHSIPGIHDVVDYAPGVSRLRYTNNLLSGFLAIDGTPDADVPDGQPEWEAVTSDAGSVVYSLAIDTNLPQFQSGFYRKDDASADACTGDETPIGMSGVFAAPLLCTDPTLSVDECQLGYRLVGTRTLQYAAPDLDRAALQALHQRAAAPLAVTVNGVGGSDPGGGDPNDTEDPPAGLTIGAVHPNPFTSESGVSVQTDRPIVLRAALVDALGRTVQLVHDGPVFGQERLRIAGGALESGVYWLHLAAEEWRETLPLVRAH